MQQALDHIRNLSFLRPPVPHDSRLHPRRLILYHHRAPSAQHRQQRPPALGKGQSRLGKTCGKRRLNRHNAWLPLVQDRPHAFAQGGQSKVSRGTPGGDEASILDLIDPLPTADNQPPPRDSGPGIEAQNPLRLSRR